MTSTQNATSSLDSQNPRARSWNPLDHIDNYSRNSLPYERLYYGLTHERIYVWADSIAMLGCASGLVFSQIRYWLGTRRAGDAGQVDRPCRARDRLQDENDIYLNGVWWNRTNRQLLLDTGLDNERTLRRAISKLRDGGLITTQQRGAWRFIGRGGNWNEWPISLRPESRSNGVVLDLRTLRICNGHIADALLLSKIFFWHGLGRNKRCRIRIWDANGYPWLAKTWRALGNEVGLSSDLAKAAGQRLIQLGILRNQPRQFCGKRVSHLAIGGPIWEWVQQQSAERTRPTGS